MVQRTLQNHPCMRFLQLQPPLITTPGSEIVSTFDNPESVKLGHCKVIEEIMIGEDRMVHFQGCALNEACTIVLRGASTWTCFPVAVLVLLFCC